MASTEYAILEAVKDAIEGLDFEVSPEEIAIRKWPWDESRGKNHWYPGITIHRVQEIEYPGTNERDDIGYGIQITMVVDNSGDPEEFDLLGDWRQKIRKAFIHQRLTDVICVCTCLVQPGDVYKSVPENYDIDILVLRIISRETRT